MLETFTPQVSNLKDSTYEEYRFSIHTFYFSDQYDLIHQSWHIKERFFTNEKESQ